jgi:hypothetical protein
MILTIIFFIFILGGIEFATPDPALRKRRLRIVGGVLLLVLFLKLLS